MISEAFAVPGRVTGIKTTAKWNKDAARWEKTTVFQVQVSDTDLAPERFGEICRQLADVSGEPLLFSVSSQQLPLPGVVDSPQKKAPGPRPRARANG